MNTQFQIGEYIYHLRVTETYAGASYTCAKPREGEDWLRGGDLLDGKLEELPRVLEDIGMHALRLGRYTVGKCSA